MLGSSLLENYAAAGVLLTAVILYSLFYRGLVDSNPLITILVITFAVIPVAGVLEQALVTALILFGPAIEDSASGKSVLQGAVVRTALFIAVSFYAWGTIWLLERWRAAKIQPSVGESTI